MDMLHAVFAFNRIANARTLLAAGADAGHYWQGQTPLSTSASIGNGEDIAHGGRPAAATSQAKPPPSTLLVVARATAV